MSAAPAVSRDVPLYDEFSGRLEAVETVEVRSRVAFVGTTSMAVVSHVYAENVSTGGKRHTNECWLTFVHLDEHGEPVINFAIPGIDITFERKATW